MAACRSRRLPRWCAPAPTCWSRVRRCSRGAGGRLTPSTSPPCAAPPPRPSAAPFALAPLRGHTGAVSGGNAILITGAARGIGRATARLAAQRGWSVGVNYLREERAAHELVDEIARGGGKAVALRGDVTNEADVAALFEGAAHALGPLTGVVANAGMVAPASRLADMGLERMRRMFEVNILGVFLT